MGLKITTGAGFGRSDGFEMGSRVGSGRRKYCRSDAKGLGSGQLDNSDSPTAAGRRNGRNSGIVHFSLLIDLLPGKAIFFGEDDQFSHKPLAPALGENIRVILEGQMNDPAIKCTHLP